MKTISLIIMLFLAFPLFAQEDWATFLVSPSFPADAHKENPKEASPEVASSKVNQPVKKESLLGAMLRIQSDGNSVGFIFNCLRSKDSFVPEIIYKTYDNNFLNNVKNEYLRKLKEVTGIDALEVIDLNKIPLSNETFVGTPTVVFDWFNTKYKLVIVCDFKLFISHASAGPTDDSKPPPKLTVHGSCTVYNNAGKQGKNKLKWKSNINLDSYYQDVEFVYTSEVSEGFYKNLPTADIVQAAFADLIDKGISNWADKKLNK